MTKLLVIKALIWSNPGSQREFSRQINMAESRLSEILGGKRVPNPKEKEQISAGLGFETYELFPDDEP